MAKDLIGKISHYYPKIGVAVVDVKSSLKVGDKIAIEGANTSIHQTVESIQVEHKNVQEARKGDSVGLKVEDRVRLNDNVYREE